MTTSTARQQYREVLATLAEKTTTKIPTLNGRVEKATRLALMGDIELHPDGHATVYSSSDPTRRYEIIDGMCPCRDWEQAPEHLCQHRLAAGFVRKVATLLPPAPVEAQAVAPAPLPEAACSVNCHLMIEGRQVQLTLRGTSEEEVLAWLATVLRQYPTVPAGHAKKGMHTSGETADPGQSGWCSTHGVPMKWNDGRDGRKGWHSHKTDEGWCQGR